MNVSEILKNYQCTGCGVCYSSCLSGAIKMKNNEEGFLIPIIDKSKCVQCGLCVKKCPAINPVFKKYQYFLPKVYAGWNKNEKSRLKSSSGGIFSVLAEYFLKKKGYVCGAAFDEKNKLKHIIISKKKDLYRLRGSKYVQSEIGDVYKEIRKILEKNKWVLFSGTPCQVAGLKNFLQKDYKTLLTVDIICHGVPSPLIFKKYLSEIERACRIKIDSIEFRNKFFGWKLPSFVLKNKDGIFVKEFLSDNIYGKGFMDNLYLRPVCTNCIYTEIPKISDISLGDFWGIGEYKEKLDDDKGTSIILINNKKGMLVFNAVKNNSLIYEEISLDDSNHENHPNRFLIPMDCHPNRQNFFDEFSKTKVTVGQLISKYLNNIDCKNESDRYDVGILNFHYENFNFGANLVAYSLQTVIEKLGFTVKSINYVPFENQKIEDKICSLGFYKFRERFLKMTMMCKTEFELIKLNNKFNTFVVGSDQVWKQLITGKNALHYFFDFVSPSKNIMSYGASFGNTYWDGDEITTEAAKKLLPKFSSISVREIDATKILSDKFGISGAISVLDPTLLLNEKDYIKIIDSEKTISVSDKYIAYYFLLDCDSAIENSPKMKEIAEYLECKIVNISGSRRKIFGKLKFVWNSVPNWLSYIKNCNYVFTDSYHGVLFSIIFKKDFFCVGKNSKALNRFESLFSILKIKGRFLNSLEDVNDNSIFLRKINYTKVYDRLNLERKKSIDFLKRGLDKKISDIDKINRLEREFVLIKTDNFNIKKQEIEFKNQILLTKYQELFLKNQELQNKTNNLELALQSYLNTKTFRYAKKIKKLLLKIGIKKYF